MYIKKNNKTKSKPSQQNHGLQIHHVMLLILKMFLSSLSSDSSMFHLFHRVGKLGLQPLNYGHLVEVPFSIPNAQWGWPIYLQNRVVLGVPVGRYTIHWASGYMFLIDVLISLNKLNDFSYIKLLLLNDWGLEKFPSLEKKFNKKHVFPTFFSKITFHSTHAP